MSDANDPKMIEAQAAAWRTLVGHLQKRDDVANIDLMILAGFCRNCMSRWLLRATAEAGMGLDAEGVRELIYGMPYDEWKAKQPAATGEQLAAFKAVTAEQTTE